MRASYGRPRQAIDLLHTPGTPDQLLPHPPYFQMCCGRQPLSTHRRSPNQVAPVTDTTDKKAKKLPPCIRVATRQSDTSHAVASESADPSGPPACAERAGAEARPGLGWLLSSVVTWDAPRMAKGEVGRQIHDKQVMLNCKARRQRGFGLCVGITYPRCNHVPGGYSLRRVGPALSSCGDVLFASKLERWADLGNCSRRAEAWVDTTSRISKRWTSFAKLLCTKAWPR